MGELQIFKNGHALAQQRPVGAGLVRGAAHAHAVHADELDAEVGGLFRAGAVKIRFAAAFDEQPVHLGKVLVHVAAGDHALVHLEHGALPDKGLQRQACDIAPGAQKMQRGVRVGARMQYRSEQRHIAGVPGGDGAEHLELRRRIARIHRSGAQVF